MVGGQHIKTKYIFEMFLPLWWHFRKMCPKKHFKVLSLWPCHPRNIIDNCVTNSWQMPDCWHIFTHRQKHSVWCWVEGEQFGRKQRIILLGIFLSLPCKILNLILTYSIDPKYDISKSYLPRASDQITE